MALFEYWMVYLPEFNPDSFLLFDHDSDGRTTLRDYSRGTERKLGSPSVREVREATEWNRTRFEESPHPVNGPEGRSRWALRTAEYNDRYLASAKAVARPERPARATLTADTIANIPGRAKHGSQRQLQDYVNLRQPVLDAAIVASLPPTMQQNPPQINWVSPLAADHFREYRDAEFLAALGLKQYSADLSRFWPERGPCWDGLAILRSTNPRSTPVSLLVEAKSHVPEVYGQGCQAGAKSRAWIQESMERAKQWCGAQPESDWMGPLYQSANRISHLYFLQVCLNRPCILVNLYFVDDPYRQTTRADWLCALARMEAELGLTRPVRGLIDVFVPALSSQGEIPCREDSPARAALAQNMSESSRRSDAPPIPPAPALPVSTSFSVRVSEEELSFAAWCRQWTILGSFQGAALPNPQERIRRLLELWQESIPGRWQRDIDHQLLGSRYRRGDLHAPHPGEHTIEHEILVQRFERVSALGGKLIDGVNAFPLACDFASGGRRGNVEADMLLATGTDVDLRLLLCEVKATANDPWYAAVECLRQLRLFLANPVGRSVMQQRGLVPRTSAEIPVTGLVVAPIDYYRAPGKRGNAVEPAQELFRCLHEGYGIDSKLAVWNAGFGTIREF